MRRHATSCIQFRTNKQTNKQTRPSPLKWRQRWQPTERAADRPQASDRFDATCRLRPKWPWCSNRSFAKRLFLLVNKLASNKKKKIFFLLLLFLSRPENESLVVVVVIRACNTHTHTSTRAHGQRNKKLYTIAVYILWLNMRAWVSSYFYIL